MKYRYLVYHILFAAAAFCAQSPALEYSFQVPEMELHVTVNPDASVTMEYRMNLMCNEGARAIDIVDIGTPHRGYDMSNMKAYLNGEKLDIIRHSEVVHPGVEVPLTPPIDPGQSGQFEINLTMPDMVYQDTTRAENASLRITPTWFDGDYLTGSTDLLVAVYLPRSIEFEEILYQKEQFTDKIETDTHHVAIWNFPDTRLTGPHIVGISFPKHDMERVVRMTKLGLVWKWWVDNPMTRLVAGIAFLIAFGIFFYTFSGGTGTCLFLPLIIVMAIIWAVSPALQALFIPMLIPVWYLFSKILAGKRRKYLPAIESVSGGEIKRGLAVPEAAVLIEQPLGRVLSLVLFGMMKKNLVRLVSEQPLQVELVEGYDTTRTERRKVAGSRNTLIRGFEQPFLDEIAIKPAVSVEKLNFSKAMKELVEGTARRVKGFDVEKTREYYQSIVNKAWQEARQIGEVEERTEFVDDNLLWLMMWPEYNREFDNWHHSGYRYRPTWSTPASGSSAPRPSTTATTATPVGGRTSLGDVGASFAGWSENVTGRLASSMDPITVGLVNKGVVNLSGVDKVGMAMLESSGSSSGGGGSGCACACAGCACACACAGGGR